VPSIGLIACDHGFGHIRRLIQIGNELVRRGVAVTLFAPAEISARLRPDPSIVVADLRAGTTPESLRRGDASAWVKRLPPIDSFDLVVSDNLPEVLAVRDDVVLSGTFLWHLVVDVDAGLHRATEAVLARHRPRMIGSRVFCMPTLAERTSLLEVGLYADEVRPEAAGADLMVTCGGTAAMQEPFRELIETLATGPRPPFPVVWVEPRLVPSNAPPWMRPATFELAMYRELLAVVCRAGVGTLTDCAWAQARAFMTAEAGNAELAFNSQQFVELGIGEATATPLAAYRAACAFHGGQVARNEHARAVATLDFNGATQSADLLMTLANR